CHTPRSSDLPTQIPILKKAKNKSNHQANKIKGFLCLRFDCFQREYLSQSIFNTIIGREKKKAKN
ncbi:MAG: hypothetical protein Q8807_03745, partial ['Waltheria sp.' little leaf phytoplasma]|nr:hypothetical protein ['Waltheria sp.' little leaf phytoplasma]